MSAAKMLTATQAAYLAKHRIHYTVRADGKGGLLEMFVGPRFDVAETTDGTWQVWDRQAKADAAWDLPAHERGEAREYVCTLPTRGEAVKRAAAK
jgi:hypothetical protein